MSVEIQIHQGNKSVENPNGITVIIDVIRAFTTAHVAFEKEVKNLYLVKEKEGAFELKKKHPDWLLAGEIDALPIIGFDFNNSPYEIEISKVKDRVLVLRTTSGVAAALNNLSSKVTLVAGLVNARAIAEYCRKECEMGSVNRIDLIASHPTGDEDLACAEYIRAKILNLAVDLSHIKSRIKNSINANKFYDIEDKHFVEMDMDHCIATKKSEFVMSLKVNGENVEVIKEKTYEFIS